MTRQRVLDWLAARRPERPPILAERMTRAVLARAEADLDAEDSLARCLGSMGIAVLAAVVAGDAPSPDQALDLLAADAFVTYAVEAAAEEALDVAPLVRTLVREAGA